MVQKPNRGQRSPSDHEVERDPERDRSTRRGSDHEELRLAVAMVGGSSLCVYIGGVAHELRRTARTTDRQVPLRGVYGELLDLMRTDVRIDVISGTSAGGLNGACLALAQTRGAKLGTLRDLWMDKGDFSKLLRPIGKGSPPSLLRGDEFFLPALHEAMVELWKGVPAEADRGPLHLQLTIVSMEGTPRRDLDDFGTALNNTDHLAYCTFERPTRLHADVNLNGDWRALLEAAPDDFDRDDVPEQLALAARSSGSFPVAFEPSLVPMTGEDAKRRPLHPNMRGIASLKRSGYVLDGGVLMNQPVRPALRAIYDMAADQQVRRVLAFVVPHPTGEPVSSPVAEEAPPASEVLAKALVTLPRAQSLSAELDELRTHNRRVRSRRAQRLDLMELLGGKATSAKVLGLVARLWPMYRAAHQRRLVEWILDEVERGVAALRDETDTSRADIWDRDLVRASLTAALGEWDMPVDNLLKAERLVETGPAWRWDLSAFDRMAAIVLDLLKRAVWLVAFRDPEQSLTEPQARALEKVQSIRRDVHGRLAAVRLLRTVDRGYWAGSAVGALEALARTRPEIANDLTDWAKQTVAAWPGQQAPSDAREGARRPGRWTEEPDRARQVLHRLAAGDGPADAQAVPSMADAFRAELGDQTAALADDLRRILPALRTAADTNSDTRAVKVIDQLLSPRIRTREQRRTRQFAQLLDLLSEGDEQHTLRVLLALQLVQQVTGGDDVLEQPIELVQVDADVPSPFGAAVRSGWEKLGGAKLGHFGAFYKRSWSANDWMWGRLDGAARLAEILLDPARLLQLGYCADSAAAAIRRVAVGPEEAEESGRQDTWQRGREGDPAYLDGCWKTDRNKVTAELAFLDDPNRPLPPRVPVCAAAVARRLQLEILREELPVVARAARADLDAGTARTPASSALVALLGESSGDEVPAALLVDALATAQVGREGFIDEVGTDRFTDVASHGAVVAAATVGAGAAGPLLAPVRRLANGVRGGLLAFAMFAKAATRRSSTGFAVVAVLLAMGAALTGLSILGGGPTPETATTAAQAAVDAPAQGGVPASLAALGAALFWGGVLLAIVRSGVVALLLVVVGGLGSYVALRAWFLRELDLRLAVPGGRALAIAVLVVALVVLGTVSLPGWPKLVQLRQRIDRDGDTGPGRWNRGVTWLLIVSLLTVAVCAWGFAQFDPPARSFGTAENPGMLRFQLISSTRGAADILTRWDGDELANIQRQLLIDLAFLLALTVAVSILLTRIGRGVVRRGASDLGRFGREWAWIVPIGGALDALENTMLLWIVSRANPKVGAGRDEIAQTLPDHASYIAGLAAAGKWIIFVVAALYVLVCLGWWVWWLATDWWPRKQREQRRERGLEGATGRV